MEFNNLNTKSRPPSMHNIKVTIEEQLRLMIDMINQLSKESKPWKWMFRQILIIPRWIESTLTSNQAITFRLVSQLFMLLKVRCMPSKIIKEIKEEEVLIVLAWMHQLQVVLELLELRELMLINKIEEVKVKLEKKKWDITELINQCLLNCWETSMDSNQEWIIKSSITFGMWWIKIRMVFSRKMSHSYSLSKFGKH